MIDLYNNNNLDYGVIWREEVNGYKYEAKICMNDKNLALDRGELAVYAMCDNNQIPQGVHLELNERYDGEYYVDVYREGLYMLTEMMNGIDCEIYEDYFEMNDVDEDNVQPEDIARIFHMN